MYFYLKEPKATKETPIILQYYVKVDKKNFRYSTGEKIHPENWDFSSRLPIVKKGAAAVPLNRLKIKILDYHNFLERIVNSFEINNETVTIEKLKQEFDRHFKKIVTTYNNFKYFTDFVDDFCTKATELINPNTKRHYPEVKVKQFQKTANRLREYEAKNGKLELSNFTKKDYNNIVNYLYVEKYSPNTVGDHIKNIKNLLKVAQKMFNYEVCEDYKEFSVIREDSESIALNETEITQILNYDFSDKPHLQNCRDIAIIGFWTGLRISDLLSLPQINPNEKFITVQPKKTKNSSGVKVVIPLHHHIKEVITKRGMPHMISDVKFNKYIKTVCEEVGLKELTYGSLMVTKDKVSRKETNYFEKHKLVSSHTCRRSFATNLYKMNFPTLSIMKITGHSSEKTFLKYIKVTPTEHAEKLLQHWEEYYNKKASN